MFLLALHKPFVTQRRQLQQQNCHTEKKSRIQEPLNLSNDADSSTTTFFGGGGQFFFGVQFFFLITQGQLENSEKCAHWRTHPLNPTHGHGDSMTESAQ